MYLSGVFRADQVPRLLRLGVGVMLQPATYAPERVGALGFPCWAVDNGCFAQGDRFSLDAFYRWLGRVPRHRLLFVTAPDVFGNARATLERSLPVLRDLDPPRAFVAQNGATVDLIPWDDLEWLFLGGDTKWKLGPDARRLAHEALRRDKFVHMGRVNSEKRIRYASAIGCAAADGTFLKYRNRIGDGSREMERWFHQRLLPLHPARALFSAAPPSGRAEEER